LAFAVLAVLGLRYANLRLLDQRLVDISEMPDSVVSAGFSISSENELEIDVSSFNQVRFLDGNSNSVLVNLSNLFVIDARTKDVVWNLRDMSIERDSDGSFAYRGSIALPKGTYILTCSVNSDQRRQQNSSWVSWLDEDRVVQSVEDDTEGDSHEFRVTVTGRGKKLSASEVVAAIESPAEPVERVEREERESRRAAETRTGDSDSEDRRSGDVLVNLTRLEDEEAKFGHFSLRRTTDVRVYAVGEGMSGEMHDYGWIVNTANGRTVWEMRYRDTEHAGGNSKNRLVDTTISLRRGNYVVYFVTDDSHSFDDWNARAPYDEEGWGIKVSVAGDEENGLSDSWIVLAQLTGIRDDVRRRTYFALDRRTKVRVYAIGEGDRDEMYDYAWVEDADTRNTIWEMVYRNTEHAGGASKNRLIDAAGWLPAGEYVLRYRSDGSHSPESWNADPPRDRRNYGVTLFVEKR
jgi:hypothetical protein